MAKRGWMYTDAFDVARLLDRNGDDFIDKFDLVATFLSSEEKHDEDQRDLCLDMISEVAWHTRIHSTAL